jgi:hypothetical protein
MNERIDARTPFARYEIINRRIENNKTTIRGQGRLDVPELPNRNPRCVTWGSYRRANQGLCSETHQQSDAAYRVA